EATFAWNVTKEEEKIDFSQGGMKVYNHIRGLIPSPVGYAYLDNKKIKFHEVSIIHETCHASYGEIIGLKGDYLLVSLGSEILKIKVLQPEGKPKMTAKDFYNGQSKKIIGKKFE
ncbi:MAG: methionyl-tRNA formyltransferase, partial [Traorella sp.]